LKDLIPDPNVLIHPFKIHQDQYLSVKSLFFDSMVQISSRKTWATASRSVIGNAVEERGTSTKFGGITAVNVALG
jgi:hypothetical protein